MMNSYLTLENNTEGEEHSMQQLLGSSITYRVAVGPQQGRKVAGFSLHSGVATKANERKKLERICRYIARPAVSEKRLAPTQGVDYLMVKYFGWS